MSEDTEVDVQLEYVDELTPVFEEALTELKRQHTEALQAIEDWDADEFEAHNDEEYDTDE